MDTLGSPNFSEYCTVSEAAKYLGVSTATLRNWDRNGKLKPRRHPQNGYRIYLHEELETVLRSVDAAEVAPENLAPPIDWNSITRSDHFVQFYETDEYLIQSVSGFVGAALAADASSVVIATPDHRRDLLQALSQQRTYPRQASLSGRLVMLDAAETLERFMVDGLPDPALFQQSVGQVIADLSSRSEQIHAFGEMVALLWANGERDAAIRLEQLWNELGSEYQFALFCAYPLSVFGTEDDALPFESVCGCHSRVFPSESYAAVPETKDRLRAISQLQQKAQALEAEIAHREHVEQELLFRERELADLVDNATEGIHKVGPDGTVLWANHADCDLLGYPIDEYIGRPIADFHVDAEVLEEIMQRLARGETLHNFHARLKCRNGDIKHVLINSSVRFKEGEFAYTRCFTRDITDRWLAEEALKQVDRRKDEFLAMLAHELRNPLAPIVNALEILKLNPTTADMNNELHSVMERQVRHLSRLVDDLLDVSRITRDKINLKIEAIDLAAVIHAAVETTRPLFESQQHELTLSLPEQSISLNADATRLTQVFANLLNNAAKYTPPGGRVWVTASQGGGHVRVSVRDNGIGIACDDLAHVFEMFSQVDGSLDRARGGLGIGLTLVRRLVEMHGGTINATSEGAGHGSEFVVQLPLATEPGT